MPVNLKVVVPGQLYRSGTISPNEIRMLYGAPYNIRKIISLDQAIATMIAPYVKKAGIEHVVIPISPGGNVRSPASTIAGNARDLFSSEGAVLVHCARGQDRTGFAVAIYRVIIQGWSCTNAINEAHSFGYGTGIADNVENQLNAEICKHCRSSHTHYCEEQEEQSIEQELEGTANYRFETKFAQKDVRDVIRDNLMLEGNPANIQPPAFNSQQSFSLLEDVTNEGLLGKDVLDAKDSDMKERLKILLDIIEEEFSDKNEIQVGLISNYNGIPNSDINPPSGSMGGTPGSNMSAGPVSGTLPQI